MNQVSKYEEKLVNELIKDIILLKGRGLDREDCFIVCWIAYLESKLIYAGQPSFWENIAFFIINKVDELRAERNRIFRVQSRLSLNQSYGKSEVEVRESLRLKTLGLEEAYALWDFIERLGKEKAKIMRLMIQGEDDSYILKTMGFSKRRYEKLKEELKKDMIYYENL